MDFTRTNGHSVAEFKGLGMHGLRSPGAYILILQLEIDMYTVIEEPRPYLDGLNCHLYLKTRSGQFLLGKMFSFNGDRRFHTYPHTHKVHHEFALKLMQSEFDSIELYRAGGDLEFEFKLFGSVIEGGEVREGKSNRTVVINQTTWLKILDTIGYSKVLAFEIPTVGCGSNPKLNDAFVMLQESQKAFQRGEWRNAIGFCRDSLEVVKAYGDELTHKTAHSKEERYQLVQKFIHFTHLAKHFDTNEARTTSWKREDALFILTSTAALVHKLSLSPEEI